jgi:lysyl-tRNA synthetase class 2
MTKRDMGKLTFAHVADGSGTMQIALKADSAGEAAYTQFVSSVDSGDFVAVQGERFVTHKGEESILVHSWSMLAKALLPLPDKFHGLQNEELKNRKRYLDFLANPEEKKKILIRANILRYVREFLYDHGFIEVETPVLESVASGAAAKPFVTHINAYDMDMYLRIACGELWQKRLLVGGFEKIFEMGRVFRNEGVDREHNPEFTMIEYYWAYADARDNMRFHEELIPFIVEKSTGSLQIDHDGETIDFTGPYPQITFHDAVLEQSGIDIDACATTESLAAAMKKKKLEVEAGAERGKLLDSLYKQTTRPKLRQPTFVLNYPVELKPLAKKAADPRYTDMFQLIVAGFELSNSYTELNDPIDQRERFLEQTRLAAGGEEEVMGADLDFVEALEHGMPPATGTGIGIDRFATLISGSHSIREVTAFPLVRPSAE